MRYQFQGGWRYIETYVFWETLQARETNTQTHRLADTQTHRHKDTDAEME